MRRLRLPATFVLTLLTGLALANTRLVLSDAGVRAPVAPASDAARTAVLQFYDTVNAAIATGNNATVQTRLSLAFEDHSPFPGASPDRAGYLETLARLHAANPTLTLRIETMVVEGDRVALSLSTQRSEPDTVPLAVPGGRWPATEILQMDGNTVAARWGNTAGLAVAAPVLRLSVSLRSTGHHDISLRRLTFPDQPLREPELTPGPQVLMVEQGSLNVRLGPGSRSAATLLRGGQPVDGLGPGGRVTVVSGEAILLAPDSFLDAWSASDTPAVALSLVITPPYIERGNAGLGARAVASPAPGGTGPVTLALGLAVPLPSTALTITLNQVALAPGVTIPSHRVVGAELLALISGELATTVEDGTAYQYKPATGGLTLTDDPALIPGQGLLLEAGTVGSYHAGETEPATLLFVTIEPGLQEGVPLFTFPPANGPAEGSGAGS